MNYLLNFTLRGFLNIYSYIELIFCVGENTLFIYIRKYQHTYKTVKTNQNLAITKYQILIRIKLMQFNLIQDIILY